jgi:hypothetical protein
MEENQTKIARGEYYEDARTGESHNERSARWARIYRERAAAAEGWLREQYLEQAGRYERGEL